MASKLVPVLSFLQISKAVHAQSTDRFGFPAVHTLETIPLPLVNCFHFIRITQPNPKKYSGRIDLSLGPLVAASIRSSCGTLPELTFPSNPWKTRHSNDKCAALRRLVAIARETELTNPLYDQLFGPNSAKDTVFLLLRAGSAWTYRAFLEKASHFAHAMRGYGLKEGDRVAVQIAKLAESLAGFAATVRAGLVFLTLSSADTTQVVS